MRNRTMVICAAVVAAALFALTCNKDSGPNGPGAPSTTWTYSTSGDSLVIEHPQTVETDCGINGLVADTTPAYSDTRWFAFSAGQDTLYVAGGQRDTMVLVRAGSGTGIQGQWTMNREGLDVTVDVGPTTMTASMCFGDAFMQLESLYEALYDIDVVSTSCNSVMIIGNITNEHVTIAFTQAGNSPDDLTADRIYSSDNPQHLTGTVYANPSSCPNDEPAWFDEFFSDNQ